jgi:OPT oligopeptide transporter protein
LDAIPHLDEFSGWLYPIHWILHRSILRQCLGKYTSESDNAVYNMQDARKFPFLSPMMFSEHSTSQGYMMYNQTAILDKSYTVQPDLLEKFGLPRLTSSHAFAMIVRNIGITAAISHMSIWHWQDIKSAFGFLARSNLQKLFQPKTWNLKFWQHKKKVISQEEAEAICPHYALMQAYDEVPSWWFAATWMVFTTIGLITSQLAGSTLPPWAFFIAILMSASTVTFFAALTAMFGFPMFVQPLIQMIGAYLVPGRPLANMYFGMFGFNSLAQTQHLLKDLKLGQYFHLAPRCTFSMQLFGSLIGCITSYAMMQKITTEKRDILLSIQGTNVWSGQMLQGQNTQVRRFLTRIFLTLTGRYRLLDGEDSRNTCTDHRLDMPGCHGHYCLVLLHQCHSG